MATRILQFFLLLLCAPVFAAVPIQHWTTPQGARVLFVENRDIPMIDVAVDFPAGSRFDPAQKNGLGRLTHALLDQGAGGMSDVAIAEKLADAGALLGGTFDRDRAGVSLRTLSSREEREAALEILLAVLHKPAFSASVFQRERGRLIAALRDEESRPGEVAEKAFYRALYGNQGYGLPESGSEESLMKLAPEELAAWHQRRYRAGNAVISLIGDLSRDEAEQLALKITAGLPQGVVGGKPEMPPAETAPAEKRIAHPSQQSHVLLGQVVMARNDPDFFPLYVGNHVLGGGGFDSRMIGEVRQKRGYAYSAYSYFLPMSRPGPLLIGLQTKNAQAADALKVARETVEEFVAKGPTPEELQQAKNNLIGGFPLRIDSNKEVLDYLRAIGFYKLPLTYLDDWVKKVEAVTLDQVRDAFKRRVNPARLSVVIVGGEGG